MRNKDKIRAGDLSINRGLHSMEIAAMVNGERVSMKYIGFSKRDAVRDFLHDINEKAAWEKWLKDHNTNAMVWPFNAWQTHLTEPMKCPS